MKTPSWYHQKNIPFFVVGAFAAGSLLGIAIPSTISLWFLLWIAAIIIPVIMGMAGKLEFKWVLLWEAVMLLPVSILLVLLFGTAVLGFLKK